jgi:hypothetical protein
VVHRMKMYWRRRPCWSWTRGALKRRRLCWPIQRLDAAAVLLGEMTGRGGRIRSRCCGEDGQRRGSGEMATARDCRETCFVRILFGKGIEGLG